MSLFFPRGLLLYSPERWKMQHSSSCSCSSRAAFSPLIYNCATIYIRDTRCSNWQYKQSLLLAFFILPILA